MDTSIEQLELLSGHTSMDTAYVVDDYPYGWKLRCRIRFWVETAGRGPKEGWQRFVAQTTNPKLPGEVWNRPHPQVYAPRVWMHRDHRGHVGYTGLNPYGPSPAFDARMRLSGLYDQLNQEDRAFYDRVITAARERDDRWHTWEQAVDKIAATLAATGHPPALHGGTIVHGQGRLYVGEDNFPVAVAAAHSYLASQQQTAVDTRQDSTPPTSPPPPPERR